MPTTEYIVSLTQRERKIIYHIIAENKNSKYSLYYAKILLLADINGESGGWKNAEILQFIETNIATIEKVKKKFLELGLKSALEIQSPTSNKANDINIGGYLETIFCSRKTLTFYHQDEHSFDLILSYPLNKEFLNQADLKQKIAQFHNHLLQPKQYVLKFKVDRVRVGYSAKYYLISFSGTVSGEYLEVKTTEIINLLKTLLEGFFLCVAPGEFSPLLFKIDGQIIIQPTLKTKGLPQEYNFRINLEDFITWNLEYIVSDLIYLLGSIAVETSSEILSEVAINTAESGGELLISTIEFLAETLVELISEIIGGMLEAILTFIVELIAGIFSS